ncbi:MAG: ribosome recycling factor [Candidatus Goldbacteria bacterium]|nr:ribosome recycling factor [Candidatus Goldiibacteriota bacterium]
MENTIKEMENKMKKSLEIFQHELATFRTGRANTSVLSVVQVECYGSKMPINQVASMSVIEAKTIDIRPWDKNILPDIEKAIIAANLGLGVVNTGDSLKIKFPELTEETRKEMVKKVKKMGEEAKINIRNIRREANEKLKGLEKNKEISQDDLKHGEARIQKITDKYIAEIDNLVKLKEQDLMTI